MTEELDRAVETSAFAEEATAETRAGLADIIYLPDQSQPPAEAPKTSERAGVKGRHFGPRVADPRTARFDVRCTPAFRAKALADATAAGLSLSAYVCARLGGSPGPRTRRRPSPDMAMLAKLLAEMGKSGSNLNQIAYHLNSGETVSVPELAEAIAEHRAVANAIMQALGA
jgi:hypothetical protein